MTVGQSQANFLASVMTRRAFRTWKAYRHGLRVFQSFCEGHGLKSVEEIRPEDLEGYFRWLSEPGRYSERGCRHLVSQARIWLKWATYQGLMQEDPARAPVRCCRGVLVAVPTPAQMLALLAAPAPDRLCGRRDRMLLEFLYGTGLRVQECADVKLCDLDLERRCVGVRGSKGRRQPLGKRLTESLRRYLTDIRPQFGEGEALFCSAQGGGPLSADNISERVSRYSRQVGATSFSVGSIRSAFALHLLHNGAPLEAVQKLMGHASITTTAVFSRFLAKEISWT